MGSRVRENPKRLFEFFAEVAKPDSDTDAFILQSYPPDFNEEDVINNVTKFAFPCQTDGTTVDHFTFVLTDMESMYRFGFCRHATGAQTCLCIISFLPWFEEFYNFLNLLAEILNRSERNMIDPLLRSAYVQEIPGPGIPVTVVAQQEMFSFKTPDSRQLPSIPSSRNLTEYYNAVDCNNMMKIFAGMLNERRILITSKKLSRLTACVHGSEALLYPMHWQHLFIPVLPSHLIDYCSAPMPYLIGVHSTIMQKIRRSELGDAIIVDADNNTVDSEHDDLEDLPPDVVSLLKKTLRSQQSDRIKTSVPLSGDAISKAFLHALIKLIGGYRDALRFRPGEPITFEPDAFVQTRPIHMQAFLEKMLHLQIFQQFINERLDMLNLGQGFSDIFETESTMKGDKLNAQSRYKDWVSTMKKQRKKFQKGGQDVWAEMKRKAGPMMDSAVKSLSSTGQKAYKGIKNKIGNLNKEDGNAFKSYNSVKVPGSSKLPLSRQNRPSTIVGPVLKASRPQRPPPPRSTSSGSDVGKPAQPDKLVRTQRTAARSYKVLSTDKSVDDTDPRLEYNRISINLMDDPDIQNALRKSASMEQVTHGVRKDSLSSADQSSSTDPDGTSELDIAGVSLIEEELLTEETRESSVVTNQTYMVTSDTPPIPAPRTKRRQRSGEIEKKSAPPPVAEKPLIHLESPEKQLPLTSTNFDPLVNPGASENHWNNMRVLENSPVVSPPSRHPSLSRSPAFRSPPLASSHRQTAINSTSKTDGTVSSDLDIFDPLSFTSRQIGQNAQPNNAQRPTVKEERDLMGTWDFTDITGQTKNTPPTPPSKPYKMTHAGNQRAVSSIETSKGGVGGLYSAAPGNRNPVYFPSGQPNLTAPKAAILQPQQKDGENSTSTDPFADLVDLSPAKQATSTPQRQSWQTFDQ